MRHTKGFTLIEVLVSLVLLTFVILISSTLFDRAIQNSPQLKEAIEKNNQASEALEEGILKAKSYIKFIAEDKKPDDSKPEGFDENPDTVKIKAGFSIEGRQFKYVRGYFVSEMTEDKKSKIKFNNVDKEKDNLYAFVGLAKEDRKTSSISKMYIDQEERFRLLPIIDEDGNKANTKGTINYHYEITSEKRRHYATRITLKTSSASSVKNTIITPYVEETESKNSAGADSFTLQTGDSKDVQKLIGYDEIYEIPDTDEKEIGKRIEFSDRNHIISAMTLNKNGDISSEYTTLELNEDNKGEKTLYFIGLPVIKKISAFYDMDLFISKIKKSKIKSYATLFDHCKSTDFSDIVKASGDIYNVNLNGRDIRDYLELKPYSTKYKNKVSDEISIQNAFLPKKEDQPYYNKPYGNTIYSDQKTAPVTIAMKSDHSLIIKYNDKNYKEEFQKNTKDNTYEILSCNMQNTEQIKQNVKSNESLYFQKDKGDISTYPTGFSLYTDEDGSLYLKMTYPQKNKKDIEIKTSKPIKLKYTLDDISPYKNTGKDDYSLMPLEEKDKRGDFKIISAIISDTDKDTAKLEIYALTRKKDKKDIITETVNLLEVENPGEITEQMPYSYKINPNTIQIAKTSNEDKIEFGKSTTPQELTQNTGNALEISDILLFDTKLTPEQNTANINYLYKKYMIDQDREIFDKYYTEIIQQLVK